KYLSASTPQSLLSRIAENLLNGPINSTVVLTIQDRTDQVRDIKLQRKGEFSQIVEKRTGDIIKLLPSNIGYVDLDRLPQTMVDEMFEKLKDTKAIIFDMRG